MSMLLKLAKSVPPLWEVDTPKRIVIHIGTHKTGTKTLQLFLDSNRQNLAQTDILLPERGRIRVDERHWTPGHHRLALDLEAGSTQVLNDVVSEIQASGKSLILLSSEEFHPLFSAPKTLTLVRDAFKETGYATTIVVSLRRQDTYAESLFAEYAKGGHTQSCDLFFTAICNDGQFAAAPTAPVMCFDYDRMLAPFVDVFGREQIIVRPYHLHSDPQALPKAFLEILAQLRGGLNLKNLTNPSPFENPSLTLAQLVGHILHARGEFQRQIVIDGALAAQRFGLLTHDDALAFSSRFAQSNERIFAEYGCIIDLPAPSKVRPASDPCWQLAARNRALLAEHFSF